MFSRVAIALGVGLLAVASPAVAEVDDFTFESFRGVYELDRDATGVATLEVSESLVALFPDYDQNRGIARLIPRTYRGVDLETTVVAVTDGASPRDYSLRDVGAFLEVESVVPEGTFARGPQRYDISYTQRHVVLQPSDSPNQEFYWDINGTGWPQFFGQVTAEVRIPASLAGALVEGQFACYVGQQGETNPCAIDRAEEVDGSVRFVVDHEGVFPYETVTVAIAFEPDTFVVSTPGTGQRWYVWLAIAAGVLALAAAGTVVWLRRGPYRDEPGRPVVIAEYLPPTEVSISTAAHVMGQTAKVPSALLVDLAVRGVVRIEAGEKKNSWRIHRTDQPLAEADEAALVALLGSVSAAGSAVDLPKGPSSQAAERMKALVHESKKRASADGYYREGVGALPVIVQVVFGVLGGLVALAALGGDEGILWFPPDQAPGWVAFGLFAAGLAIGIGPVVVLSKKPLSSAGAEVRDHLKGLRLYLDLAEKDRLAYLQSPKGALREPVNPESTTEVLKLYERLLPWAILLGVDKQWLGILEAYYEREQRPTWIVTPQALSLSDAFSSFSTQTLSSYQSSGSSGSGGGGSAGGGGGGGGGGGR